MSVKLTIEFANQKAMEHFAHWLDGQGEQDYRIWMECREAEEDGDITVTKFEYFSAPGKGKRRKFLGDATIRTTCGRVT